MAEDALALDAGRSRIYGELEVLALIAKDFGLAVNPAEALIERQGIFGNGKKLIDLV